MYIVISKLATWRGLDFWLKQLRILLAVVLIVCNIVLPKVAKIHEKSRQRNCEIMLKEIFSGNKARFLLVTDPAGMANPLYTWRICWKMKEDITHIYLNSFFKEKQAI